MFRTAQPQTLSPRAALLFVNGFRALLLLVLFSLSLLPGSDGLPLIEGGRQFYLWSGVYVLLIGVWYSLREGKLGHTLQLTLAIAADIAMMVWLMAMNDGVHGGFGLLLLPYLAAAGLLSSGRYALFYAAIATLALFSYSGVEHWLGRARPSDLPYSALLASAGFATAIATWQLGRMARASEELAARRGGEIANLNHLNELILQSQRDAVVVLDEDGHLRQFNLQAERYFNRLQRGQLLPELLPLVRRWRDNGYPALSTFVEHNVRGRQMVGRLVPVPVPEGQLRGVVLFMRDMADMAEEAKRVKLAALGRLTANIAHEIRNPLSAIRHAADLLAEDEEDPARRRLLGIVQDNTRRINGMVEDVLTLGRRDRVRRETIALASFIAQQLEQFAMAQPDAAGAVRCELAGDCRLSFDRGHLAQILGNLLANAWRHGSRRPGSVRLQAGIAENHLILRVIDDGPGVAEADQARLFEPFFTTESAGSGLGLYIARELAEANDARLDYSPPGGVFRLICHLAYD
ncbi:two-component system sensor histidine kinase NtrB [Chromobacterium violaceum]|uniref:two-component system sensor histidine kinase NtrB n=1 Tax=Chromobacterium violaceum TaxID=536 RepID=UPI001C8C46CC|nr:ATP-binding protein [Chromobacterium violaceum]MBX9266216.1 histidine kinase [Chromobacterium violaceum]